MLVLISFLSYILLIITLIVCSKGKLKRYVEIVTLHEMTLFDIQVGSFVSPVFL